MRCPAGMRLKSPAFFPTHWGGELLRRGAFFFASARFSVSSPSAFPAIFPPPLRKERFRCCSLLPLSLPLPQGDGQRGLRMTSKMIATMGR